MAPDNEKKKQKNKERIDRIFDHEGRKRAYLITGDILSNDVLVVFHPLGGSRSTALVFNEAGKLNHLKIVGVEAPGIGISEPVADFTPATFARDVYDLMRLCIKPNSLRVFGCSMGGVHALAFAALFPSMVDGPLALVGPWTNPAVDPNVTLFATVASYLPSFLLRLPNPILSLSSSTLAPLVARQFTKVELEAMGENIKNQLGVSCKESEAVSAAGTGRSKEIALAKCDWGFKLQEVKHRLVIWHGSDDNMTTKASMDWLIQQTGSSGEVRVVEKGTHLGPIFTKVTEIFGVLLSK